jgi:hypothetical protein
MDIYTRIIIMVVKLTLFQNNYAIKRDHLFNNVVISIFFLKEWDYTMGMKFHYSLRRIYNFQFDRNMCWWRTLSNVHDQHNSLQVLPIGVISTNSLSSESKLLPHMPLKWHPQRNNWELKQSDTAAQLMTLLQPHRPLNYCMKENKLSTFHFRCHFLFWQATKQLLQQTKS